MRLVLDVSDEEAAELLHVMKVATKAAARKSQEENNSTSDLIWYANKYAQRAAIAEYIRAAIERTKEKFA